MRLVAGHGDAPREVGAADRDILKALSQSAENFVAATLWADEFRTFCKQGLDTVLIAAQLEEVVLLSRSLKWLAGDGRDVVGFLGLRLGQVLLLPGVIPPLKCAAVHVARFHEATDEGPHLLLMLRICRADEFIVCQAEEIHGCAKLG